jgi:hypothetical protein
MTIAEIATSPGFSRRARKAVFEVASLSRAMRHSYRADNPSPKQFVERRALLRLWPLVDSFSKIGCGAAGSRKAYEGWRGLGYVLSS